MGIIEEGEGRQSSQGKKTSSVRSLRLEVQVAIDLEHRVHLTQTLVIHSI